MELLVLLLQLKIKSVTSHASSDSFLSPQEYRRLKQKSRNIFADGVITKSSKTKYWKDTSTR